MKRRKLISNPDKIDHSLIENSLESGYTVTVQFSEIIYTKDILSELNELCIKFDTDFNIRFYGHYQTPFNCDTLLSIPNVKSLYIDCMYKVENLKSLKELYALKRLSLGIYDMQEPEILQLKNLYGIEELFLGETKVINLEYLSNYANLKHLVINGRVKNINAIGKLSNLIFLELSHISKVSLSFINNLHSLKTLKIFLGGRENLQEIDENEIEILIIDRVRGFNCLDNIANFKKLRKLIIEDQLQLRELLFAKKMDELNEIQVINCKNFASLKGFENLPSLNKLIINNTNLEFSEFIKQTFPITLKTFGFYTKKTKLNHYITEALANLGFKNTWK